MFMYLHRASWHSPNTLTEVFPCFFLRCKANTRVKPAKTGHGPHSSKIFVLFYVLFVCKCVLLGTAQSLGPGPEGQNSIPGRANCSSLPCPNRRRSQPNLSCAYEHLSGGKEVEREFLHSQHGRAACKFSVSHTLYAFWPRCYDTRVNRALSGLTDTRGGTANTCTITTVRNDVIPTVGHSWEGCNHIELST